MKGFKKVNNDLITQVIVKRLQPAVSCRDPSAKRMIDRYGMNPVADAFEALALEHDWLLNLTFEAMSEDDQQMLYAASYASIADKLEELGLRLEDHMRVMDEGVAFSREAIAFIAASGYDRAFEFGEGHETLEGIGLQRDPYMHHLSEVSEIDDNFVNLWVVASVHLNVSLGWLEADAIPSLKALEEIPVLVAMTKPTIDASALIRQSRYDDRALLKLTGLIRDGLQIRCERQMGQSAHQSDLQ
jgi:hypothetical protein